MRKDSPCNGCTKRWYNGKTTCHSTCQEYKDFRAERDEYLHEKNIRLGSVSAQITNKVKRMLTKRKHTKK